MRFRVGWGNGELVELFLHFLRNNSPQRPLEKEGVGGAGSLFVEKQGGATES